MFARLRGIVRRDENERNPETRLGESLLQLQSGHFRHVNINQHTTCPQPGQSGQELPPGTKRFCGKPCGAEQSSYRTQKRQIVVYHGDKRLRTSRKAAFEPSALGL